MTYNVLISERQRARIERALKLLDASPDSYNDEPNIDETDETHPDLEYLTSMIVKLPEDEAEHPGTLHGLCL